MSTKHTPGPWYASDVNDIWRDDGEHGESGDDPIASVHEDSSTSDGIEEARANAKLVAAAPEMAEALRNFIGFAGYHELEKHDPRLQLQLLEMRRALAKASL